MDLMKDALMKRKGKGIDLTIMIGTPDDESKDKLSSDLAPEQGSELEPMEGQEPSLEVEVEPGNEEENLDADMLSRLTDQDEKEMGERKPKSLMDRAMLDAFKRKK